MTVKLRQQIVDSANMLVVKVGSRVMTREDGTLDRQRIAELAEDLSTLRDSGREVLLVSSGAVSAGMSQLGLPQRPTDLAKLQAVAAIGQTRLIEAYDATFRQHDFHAAQVLLTASDLDDRTRYLNVRNTLYSLLQLNAIPIINENDTVAVDELIAAFGDNDRLAALVANLLRAPLLVVLSDVDGLHDGDPDDARSQLIPVVHKVDDVAHYARPQSGGIGKGGMSSKLQAARIVTAAGENMIIASGRRGGVLQDIVAGKEIGTLFPANQKTVSPRKRWIGFSAQPRGQLLLDEGACRALVDDGRSLLAIGVQQVHGRFEKGDVVAVCDATGRELARGLINYGSNEMQRIKGCRSADIAERLGHRPYEEVIHRNNLAVV